MNRRVDRKTVDLTGYPDLVVIYLGMRVNRPRGIKRLLALGPRIARSVAEKPDGLLLHEGFMLSLFPLHLGMRQYWRDFDSLESWARSLPHQRWWQQFVRDPGGTGFWHEVYSMRGGMEAIFDDMVVPFGFAGFAPVRPARGAMFSVRDRLRLGGEAKVASPLAEEALYSDSEPRA